MTSEKTGDSKKFCPIVREVSKKARVKKAYADAAYDSRYSFNLLDEYCIEPAIELKKNASAKAQGSPLGKEEVLLVQRVGYDRWKEMKEYGRR